MLNPNLSASFGAQSPRFGRNPRVALPDCDDKKVVDIDGDGIPDLSHLDTVGRYIQANCPDAEIIWFPLVPENLVDTLQTISDDTKSFDAVNLSLGRDLLLPSMSNTGLSPEQYRNIIHSNINRLPLNRQKEISLLEALSLQGKQVYSSGHNDGPGWDKVILPNLAIGAINVGATNAQGQKTHFSADNPFINRWEQGIFGVYEVPGGYDITGNGRLDVRDDEVSGGEPLVKKFKGKNLQDVLATEREFWEIFVYDGSPALEANRVVSWKRLMETGISSLQLQVDQDEYVIIKNQKPVFWMRADKDGRLYFDPDNSGRRDAVSQIHGCSFATPTALGKDLKRQFDTTA